MIAHSKPKRDYYVVSRDGRRLMQLSLGRKTLAFIGVSGKEDIAGLKDLIRRHPEREVWVPRWLELKQAA
jgi:type IV secretion system protein VirB4